MHEHWYGTVGKLALIVTIAAALSGGLRARAEEGMWTFDNVPVKQLQEKYGFAPTQQWLDHVRLSSVRFNDGGSGSFVSPHGLALTNHHVALGQLQKVSTPQKDYVKDGFYARTEAEELKCPDLELNVLQSMQNVTARVQGAAKPGASDEEALQAHKAEIAKIERESTDQTGLLSEVVTLYQGGEYWLYRYKKYTDVRLVFAPEQQAAFYGGDPDNFTYPRHDLDMALFRVYENGKPLETPNYLKINPQGAKDGELVFVSGHPGSTSRLQTVAQLETQRDTTLPMALKTLSRRLDIDQKYAAQGPEQAREATGAIFIIQNSLKALNGMLAGLRNPEIMAKKEQDEQQFRARIAARPQWEKEYGSAWKEIAEAQKKLREIAVPLHFTSLRWSRLMTMALTITQYVAEIKKPDGVRLDGFHDSQLDSLKFSLFSPAPVYPAFEEVNLAGNLEMGREVLGADNPFIKTVLSGQSPEEVAHAAINGTQLADPAVRKALVEGGEAAVQASTDPLIVLARKVDPFARAMHKRLENEVESVEVPAGQKIGEARFAAFGKSEYPDATFTLRLSYGTVKGYPMNGTIAPPMTTFYGLYDRAYSFGLKPPFDLPERYLQRQDKLRLDTPFDFVSTCDIIGGNSGSPVISKNGELVGLIFDGNIESLVGDYVYNIQANRAVAVHTAAMLEALRNLYDAGPLADEMLGQ
jgi:Peptidase S46